MASSLQRNNGGPRGYGQQKNMRRLLMNEETEDMYGDTPQEEQAEPMSLYPPQPQQAQRMDRGSAERGYTGSEVGGYGYGGQMPQDPTRGQADFGQVRDRARPQPTTPGVPQTFGGDQRGSIHTMNMNQSLGGRQSHTMTPGSPEYLASQAQTKSLFNTPMDPSDPRMGGQGFPGIDPSRGALEQWGTGNIPQVGGGLPQIGDPSRLTGFNTNGWGSGERGTESIKNTFGMWASNVDPTQPGALDAVMALPGFMDQFPMAKKVPGPKGDLLDLGDGDGPVDVLRNAVAGGAGDAWAWQPTGGGTPQGPGGPSAMAYQQGMPGQAQMPTGQFNGQAPEVVDENSANSFLEWLMSQQQQGGQQQGFM